MLGFVAVFIICVGGLILTGIGNRVQFQEVSLFVRILLYLPTLALIVVWFYSIFRYMKNIKRILKSPQFAQPNIKASPFEKTQFQDSLKHHNKLHTLIGSFAALSIFLFFFWIPYFGMHGDEFENIDRNSMRKLVSPELTTIANRTEKYFQQNNSYTKDTDNLRSGELSTWHSVFTCRFDCFESERKALEEDDNLDFLQEMNKDYNMKYVIHSEVYEFWIDKNDISHFKLRYNPKNESKNLNYDSSRICKYYPHSRTYMSAQEWDFSESLGYYVYDSKTKEFRFEYDNFWDNFLEHYKFFFFIFVYLFTIIFAFFLTKFVRFYAKYNSRPISKKLRKLTWN